jgi:hypothetical protein
MLLAAYSRQVPEKCFISNVRQLHKMQLLDYKNDQRASVFTYTVNIDSDEQIFAFYVLR